MRLGTVPGRGLDAITRPRGAGAGQEKKVSAISFAWLWSRSNPIPFIIWPASPFPHLVPFLGFPSHLSTFLHYLIRASLARPPLALLWNTPKSRHQTLSLSRDVSYLKPLLRPTHPGRQSRLDRGRKKGRSKQPTRHFPPAHRSGLCLISRLPTVTESRLHE